LNILGTCIEALISFLRTGVWQLHSKWEDLYLVLHATDHGAVTLQSDDGDILKANSQCLKLFLEPKPQDFEDVDVLDFLDIE
jgi:hypothetical protein